MAKERLKPEVRQGLATYQARKKREELRAKRVMDVIFQRDVIEPFLALARHGTTEGQSTTAIRADALNATDEEIEDISRKALASLRSVVPKWYQPIGANALKNATHWAKVAGVSTNAYSTGVQVALRARKEASIQLVENAGRSYASAVRALFSEPGITGVRVEALRARLLEAAAMPKARASLIARDQTLKTYAGISEAQNREAGINSYTWSTSQDERVRSMHADLEGEVFSYDDPPVTNDAGDRNGPGEDYQCRCSAIGIIPEN